MKRLLILFLLLSLCLNLLWAKTIMPAIFADGMILQQEANVAVWGRSKAKTQVVITTSWNNRSYQVMTDIDGKWKVRVETPKASYDKYFIKIYNDKELTTINDVLVGEVWLCSGQSNMEQSMKGYPTQPIEGGLQAIALSSNDNLRCFTVDKVSSVTPLNDCSGSWVSASPSTTGDFSATGYFFGALLQKVLNVPIGLLHCSWGGSSIEAWMSSESLQQFPELKVPLTQEEVRKRNIDPGLLFNGMLNSIVGYNIRGCIWYQGETNVGRYKQYPSLFAAMHKDWNTRWECGEFPIYFCQIAPYFYKNSNDRLSAFFRETQLEIAKTQPNTGIAILMDTGEELVIHPSAKREAGERLAYQAMSKTYGYTNFSAESPIYNSMEVKGQTVLLKFSEATMGLSSFGHELSEFEIAAEDKVFYEAKAKITREGVEVFSEKVNTPVAVRYAFRNYTTASLFGVNGLPVSSFRTDNWLDEK